MRHISFALTTEQFRARTKTVTRRLGWMNLKSGAYLMAVEKAQGLKKGEKVTKLGPIHVIHVRREKLCELTDSPYYGALEVLAEGFPGMTPADFVAMFCRHNKCTPETYVTRILFVYRH